MNNQQKELLRSDLEFRIMLFEQNEQKLYEFIELKNWIKNSLVKNLKSVLVIEGSSKKDLLIKFKEHLNFSQKEFMEIVCPILSGDYLYDENLIYKARHSKAYYINDTHPKYNLFNMGIGLLNEKFQKRIIVKGTYSYDIITFLTTPNIEYKPGSVLYFYNCMADITKNMKSDNVRDLCNSFDYYLSPSLKMYEQIENHGIDLFKTRILQILESEKSK